MTQVNSQKNDNTAFVQSIIDGIQEKKGFDISLINLKSTQNAITDYLVICSANSDTQTDSIYESIEANVYLQHKELPWHTEGKNNKEWVIIDYADVVVHIFRKDRRKFYDLEALWGDATITQPKNIS